MASSLHNTPLSPEVLAIPTQSFLNDFYKELGKNVTINGFIPDSIIINFSDIITRTIPVLLSLHASYEKQYDSTGSPQIFPSTVDVTGPPSIVEKLTRISTETIELHDLKESVKMKAKLTVSRLLSFNVDHVDFILPVEKYTEGTVELEIHSMNVPGNFSLKTFPDKVKIRYLVSLSNYSKVDNSMFDAVVDVSELNDRRTSKLKVNINMKPAFVKIIILEPDKVDYILRKQ